MRVAPCSSRALLLALALSSAAAFAQSAILEDNFEWGGAVPNPALWPQVVGATLESSAGYFGSNNSYLRISGAGRKVFSGDWSAQLAGRTSTFAFDYYEPSSSAGYLVTGYAAGTSDINVDGAFARISLAAGTVSFNATAGTSLTNSGTTNYPRDTRLTFSLVLNHTAEAQPFNGGLLPAKTMEVWYYNWQTRETVYALTIATDASTRSPAAVAFRTWSTETGVLAHFDNVKLLDGLRIVTDGFVPEDPPVPPSIPPRPFVHPSVYNTQEELERIRYRVNAEPGSAAAAGWSQLLGSGLASLSYQHVPYSNVVVVGSGTSPSETQYRRDAHAARGLALRWVMTGDPRYRDKARQILNDWANTFQTMSPAPGTSTSQIQLEAAWAAPIWVAAADLVRYFDGGSAAWSPAEIAQFDRMLDYLYGESAKSATRNNNWGASAALAMISIGAYQENRDRFNAGIKTWRDRLIGINQAVDAYNDDSIYEVCRDTVHPQYTLTVWAQAAEVAWKHDVDLYGITLDADPRPQYARNLEYFAELFMGLRQPPCDATFTGDYVGEQIRANAYDVGHNHYVRRCGLASMPVFQDLVINHWRPGGFDDHFPAWTTLTHGDLSTGVPQVISLALADANSGTVLQPLTNGITVNRREIPGSNAVLMAQVEGVVNWVQFARNDVPAGPADTTAPFTTALPEPGNYFLGALPVRAMAGGLLPGDRFVRFLTVIDLPPMWKLHNIGVPAVPAWASVESTNFTLAAAGSAIAGTYDQFGFAASEIDGDAQITACLQGLDGEDPNAQAGVMFRQGLKPGAPNVFLHLTPTPTNGVRLQARPVFNAATTNAAGANLPLPAWLRLVRFGDLFSAYGSTDGRFWTPLGTIDLPLNPRLEAGLAVASRTSNSVARVEFREVMIEPLTPSYDQWKDWLLVRRGQTNALALLPEGDPDGDGRLNRLEYYLGSDPLTPDALPCVELSGFEGPDKVKLRFTERKNAADLGRVFKYSTNLIQWSVVAPSAMVQLEDQGSVVIREVTLPAPHTQGFYTSTYPPP